MSIIRDESSVKVNLCQEIHVTLIVRMVQVIPGWLSLSTLMGIHPHYQHDDLKTQWKKLQKYISLD